MFFINNIFATNLPIPPETSLEMIEYQHKKEAILNTLIMFQSQNPAVLQFFLKICHGKYDAPYILGFQEIQTQLAYKLKCENIPGRIFQFVTVLKEWTEVKTTLLTESFSTTTKVGEVAHYFRDCFISLKRGQELPLMEVLYGALLVTSDKGGVWVKDDILKIVQELSTYDEKKNTFVLRTFSQNNFDLSFCSSSSEEEEKKE